MRDVPAVLLEDWMTRDEAMATCGLKKSAFWEKAQQHGFRQRRVHGRVLYHREDIALYCRTAGEVIA